MTLVYTCCGFGRANGISASIVTTQGEITVPRFFPRNGPSGTYSHFWEGEVCVEGGGGVYVCV